MCGGFHCSKNALSALNVLYLLVSFVLIGVASYAKVAAIIESFEIAGGIIACGLFLFIISIMGLIAASKHHQVLLFFYFVVLFLLFILQFSISIACLAVSESQEEDLLRNAWLSKESNSVANQSVINAEEYFGCCGWNYTDVHDPDIVAECRSLNICKNATDPTPSTLPPCIECDQIIIDTVSTFLVATGGIGLFFSFTEMLGVYLAVRFRNQKDPRANPSQFL